jgi:hypothetical protein
MSDEMMPDSENDIVRVTNALDPDPGKASGHRVPKKRVFDEPLFPDDE